MAPIVILTLGWISGVWLAAQFNLPWWAWLILGTLAGLGLLRWRRRAAVRWPLALAVCLGLGGARGQMSRPVYDASFVATYADQGVATIVGVVSGEPDVRDTYVNLRVSAETLLQPGQAAPRLVHGDVLISAPPWSDQRSQAAGGAEFHYGDRLSVTGLLVTPSASEDFSYKDYLARQGLYAQVPQAQVTFVSARQGNPIMGGLLDFKAHAVNVLAQIFPAPHAALISSILLGLDSSLSPDLKEAFSASGMSHVIAVSGFKVALLASLLVLVGNRLLGARHGAWVAIAGIAAYTALVGAGASVMRAAIMGSLALVGQRIGRRAVGLNTLAAAVFLLTLLNPSALWDVGFQLGAAATVGLVLYVEPLEARFKSLVTRFTSSDRAGRAANLVGDTLLLTLAAQLTALPLMAYYFKSVSLVSLAANLLILPAQPPLLALSGLALLLGLIALPLGQLAAWAAWPFSAYTLALVQFFARAPGAAIDLGQLAPWAVGAFYAVLFGLTWVFHYPFVQRPGWWKALVAQWLTPAGLGALALATVLVWSNYFSLPDGRLKISVLDVGQGEAVLVQTPSGANILVDGGPSGSALTRALARQLPLFTRQLDLLVVASPRDEGLGALPEMLKRYTVQRVVVTQAIDPESRVYATLMQQLNGRNLELTQAADRPAFDLGDGLTLRVLADTTYGSTLQLEWKRFSLLLPIGLRRADETALLKDGEIQPATALLLADHGSERANGEAWVSAVDPRVVLISVGAGNQVGDPASAVLQRLAGRTVLRTDQNGTLTMFTDGEKLWVETER